MTEQGKGKYNMNEPLVSIIMPSYNTGSFIEETINSVISQTYKNWELIIVDDCSTDNTDEVVSTFQDERIKYFKNEENSGAAISRNKAISESKGKYIAFLDSDDLWVAEKLTKQISFMEENDYSFTHTQYIQIDENSKPLGVTISAPKHIRKKGFFLYCWAGCLTVIYNAEKVGLVQIEDLEKRNDYAFWLKITKKCDCYLLKENLAMYRRRKDSISNVGIKELIKHHYKLYKLGEKMNPVSSLFFTGVNIVFGSFKKIFYVKKMEQSKI